MTRPLLPLILAGGAGTRLWPLSREAVPKPFIALPDGDTLLAKTARRAMGLPGVSTLATITNRSYYWQIADVYASIGTSAPPDPVFLLEPFGRNTAPAIALGAAWAKAKGHEDSVLLVLPSDHLIRDLAGFESAVAAAAEWAHAGRLVTFGITPTHPETGFGYIECGAALAQSQRPSPAGYVAHRFVEKPPLSTAQEYCASGNFLWNSGMFAFTPDAILAALSRYAPQVMAAVDPIVAQLGAQASATTFDIDATLFAAMPDISIDFAVMESAAADGEVVLLRAGFDWSDVGSWEAVALLADADDLGNRGEGERIAIDTRRTYVHAQDRIVATVGVEDLVIVDTPDAVLVAHREQVQRVKDVVGELKSRGHEAYKTHRTVVRPWGTYTVLEEVPGYKIKRIDVKPGAALSLQLHHHRSEHWVVVSGVARVTRDEAVFEVKANESTFIPPLTRHRLANPGTEPLAIIEVQCGAYLGEDDIVRFDDVYGRTSGGP
jgi:mannose-1-phosphate guanylyltransferase